MVNRIIKRTMNTKTSYGLYHRRSCCCKNLNMTFPSLFLTPVCPGSLVFPDFKARDDSTCDIAKDRAAP